MCICEKRQWTGYGGHPAHTFSLLEAVIFNPSNPIATHNCFKFYRTRIYQMIRINNNPSNPSNPCSTK